MTIPFPNASAITPPLYIKVGQTIHIRPRLATVGGLLINGTVTWAISAQTLAAADFSSSSSVNSSSSHSRSSSSHSSASTNSSSSSSSNSSSSSSTSSSGSIYSHNELSSESSESSSSELEGGVILISVASHRSNNYLLEAGQGSTDRNKAVLMTPTTVLSITGLHEGTATVTATTVANGADGHPLTASLSVVVEANAAGVMTFYTN